MSNKKGTVNIKTNTINCNGVLFPPACITTKTSISGSYTYVPPESNLVPLVVEKYLELNDDILICKYTTDLVFYGSEDFNLKNRIITSINNLKDSIKIRTSLFEWLRAEGINATVQLLNQFVLIDKHTSEIIGLNLTENYRTEHKKLRELLNIQDINVNGNLGFEILKINNKFILVYARGDERGYPNDSLLRFFDTINDLMAFIFNKSFPYSILLVPKGII